MKTQCSTFIIALIYDCVYDHVQFLHFLGEPHIALFDFQPQDYRELKLTRGELVQVTSVDSGGWAKAVNKDNKYGWVPQNFISPIDPKKYQEIKMKTEVWVYFR